MYQQDKFKPRKIDSFEDWNDFFLLLQEIKKLNF